MRYHGALAPIGGAALATARAAAAGRRAPRPRHPPSWCAKPIELGFGSVMFDASELDHAATCVRPREVTAAHDAGVWVEAELGEIGGKDGVHAPGVRTDPAEAAAFAAATGVDALAVAVGIARCHADPDATLDFDLIAGCASGPCRWCCTARPGCPTRARSGAGRHAKVNIATQLNVVLTAAAAGCAAPTIPRSTRASTWARAGRRRGRGRAAV